MEMAVQLKIHIDQARSCYDVTGTKPAADQGILKHYNSLSQRFPPPPPIYWISKVRLYFRSSEARYKSYTNFRKMCAI